MRRRAAAASMASEDGADGGLQQPLLGEQQQPQQQSHHYQQQQQLVEQEPGAAPARCTCGVYTYLRFVLGRAVGFLLRLLWHRGKKHAPLLQASHVDELRAAAAEPFDPASTQHQQALEVLWQAAFPGEPYAGQRSEKWKEMGWQGVDPATDVRGSGILGVFDLLALAHAHPTLFGDLLHKRHGVRSAWEYPFACAGMNLTFLLATEVLELKPNKRGRAADPEWPQGAPARGFARLLKAADGGPIAYREVYCAAFQLLDAVWVRRQATYMEFTRVLADTRHYVEAALAALPGSVAQFRAFLAMASGVSLEALA